VPPAEALTGRSALSGLVDLPQALHISEVRLVYLELEDRPKLKSQRKSTMRLILSTLVAVALAAVVAPALAQDEFDVAVAGNKVTVTTKAGWHVNKEYPWKIEVQGKKVDKTGFQFTGDSVASVAAPGTGEGVLSVGVCSGAQCKSVKVPVKL
jgi:hypothetical protein